MTRRLPPALVHVWKYRKPGIIRESENLEIPKIHNGTPLL